MTVESHMYSNGCLLFYTDHKMKSQARKTMQMGHQSVVLVAKSVLGKRGRDQGEREAVRLGQNQGTLER